MAQRTIRITVETETLTIVRHAKAALAWCSQCQAEVDIIVLPTASLSDPESGPELQDWIDRGKLHLWHSTEETIQICVPSLLQSSAHGEERPPRLP